MALKLVSGRGGALLKVPAGGKGRWLSNNVFSYHGLSGAYLMVITHEGSNPPTINIRGGKFGQYGDNWSEPTTTTVNLDENSQIIGVGAGDGDGVTTVLFLKNIVNL
jgi:hypothetical protein